MSNQPTIPVLSLRARRGLINAGFGDPTVDSRSVADALSKISPPELLKMAGSNFGKATLAEVERWMGAMGYRARIPLRPAPKLRRWIPRS